MKPERRRQSCSGFFIVNLGHANTCFDCFHWSGDNDHQANTVVKDIDPVDSLLN